VVWRGVHRPANGGFEAPRQAALCGLLAVALVILHTEKGRADPFHAQTLPLGQRAIGMAGAFAAVADDPSATYYNPAGLVWGSDSALSASLTLTAFDRSTVESGYRTSVGSSSLNHAQGASLPVFVAAAKHLGRRDAEGQRQHAIALSSFTVSQRRLSFDAEVRSGDAASGALETLSIEQGERSTWYGLTYAARLIPRLSLGLSGFVTVQRTHYDEERIGATLGAELDDGSRSASRGSWTSHLVTTNVKNMVARIGGLYAFSPQLRVGVMFQPPSLHVRGRANLRERYLVSESGGAGPRFFNVSHRNLASESPLPWELRLGAQYAFRPWLTLALDTSLYGKTGSAKDPVVAVGARKAVAGTRAVGASGAFMQERWHRTYNGNVSLGLSAVLAESVAVRCGIYTDLSSAPSVPSFSSSYRAADIHRVGGTVSIGLASDNYDFSLGMVGLYGRGDALSFNDEGGAATYERTRATDRMFFVFLQGVKSAVKTLASAADERLRQVREAERRERLERLEPKPSTSVPRP
jgi:hypothetical protein